LQEPTVARRGQHHAVRCALMCAPVLVDHVLRTVARHVIKAAQRE
jgi:hypothetical protein